MRPQYHLNPSQKLSILPVLLGFVLSAAIWNQCCSLDSQPICGRDEVNCKSSRHLITTSNCRVYACYRTLGEPCNVDDPYTECLEGLTCSCQRCMNCNNATCEMDLCYSYSNAIQKRLPKRVFPWIQRQKWQNFAQKFIESNYND